MNKTITLAIAFMMTAMATQAQRHINFNANWAIGSSAELVTLPRAWNEDDAFRVSIEQLPDSVVWYRKTFTLPSLKGKRVFIEFEGVRQAADVYVNDQLVGISENGVMAFGFDLTPFVHKGKNRIEVKTDNDWNYRERSSNSKYQWNDRNFNANYGGITKNVWLHITGDVYQTLPLYSNLKTTGTYVYLKQADIVSRTATIGVESQVHNASDHPQTLRLRADIEGTTSVSASVTIAPGETRIMQTQVDMTGMRWWSVGEGNLYDVVTTLVDPHGKTLDEVVTRTGFRTTRFGQGMVWLNDRVVQVKGYAQRTSNEWPAVGISVPAWLSDYSNRLMVESGANTVRWMHITPWKQDIESCDRVGLMQAMPAGDSEKDVDGDRWRQRTEVMRDAIIYNRNNPSIIFYEGGNESISREHVMELKAIRDQYDPHGGRAVGSREMLDINESEYGGEMLYINKSAKHPMWAMEYCRDEGLRKNYDAYSYPYHPEGEGPLHNGQPANAYNHNQDEFVVELVRRWYDYWRERPGTGTRVSSGGVKIIFSDTNTHHRGVENYRRSGVTDPMRIPKDAFYAHQVMWHGWVDQPNDTEGSPLEPQLAHYNQTYIVGHWNYEPGVTKPVYVVSNANDVELFLNGRSLGHGRCDYRFLYTFPRIQWEAGTLTAIGYDRHGRELSRHTISTAGEPAALRLTTIENPQGWQADGADLMLVEFEVVDKDGHRCPLDNRPVSFTIDGPAEWRGGIAQGPDNYILSQSLPVECGVNRVLLRSTTKAGIVTLKAEAEGLAPQVIKFKTHTHTPSATQPVAVANKQLGQPTYVQTHTGIAIASASADTNGEGVGLSYDDNELSEWRGGTAITYTLAEAAALSDVCVKFAGWRTTNYPLEVVAHTAEGDVVVWRGITPTTLGYVHLDIQQPVVAQRYTLRSIDRNSARLSAPNFDDPEAARFQNITEVAGGQASQLDATTSTPATRLQQLRIVEIEFIKSLQQ
ncbi:MAG: DUF4982 domain-containing protein [Bacteroidaceae bacterium]|nr:DUF4982 domain-containing protein [Bacteroidaceae bacterium]